MTIAPNLIQRARYCVEHPYEIHSPQAHREIIAGLLAEMACMRHEIGNLRHAFRLNMRRHVTSVDDANIERVLTECANSTGA